jgi:hypothetical protein
VAQVDKTLYRAYLLKEQFRLVFQLGGKAAIRALDGWCAWTRRSRIPAFVDLYYRIMRHRESIVAMLTNDGLSNALVESTPSSVCSPAPPTGSSPPTTSSPCAYSTEAATARRCRDVRTLRNRPTDEAGEPQKDRASLLPLFGRLHWKSHLIVLRVARNLRSESTLPSIAECASSFVVGRQSP